MAVHPIPGSRNPGFNREFFAVPSPSESPPSQGSLLHILGASFGIAGAVGSSIGAGILRTPGLVAAQLGSAPLMLLVWLGGGIYSLFGALAVAELAAALPSAGGWYVYARRAAGDQAGFSVGWIDWLGQCAGLAWVAVTIGEYSAALLPWLPVGSKAIGLVVLLTFALVQLLGLAAGSLSQKLLSLAKAGAFLILIAACFWFAPHAASSAAPASAGPLADASLTPPQGRALAVGLVFALQAVITTYDGWHSPIYFAEEFSDPAAALPRSLVGGVLAVTGLYLLVNLALLQVLSLPELAGSRLPLADAARLLFGGGGAQLITVLALISCLGLINAVIMAAPRVLYGLARDGLFLNAVAGVSSAGTPLFALGITTLTAAALLLVGDFAILLGMAAFFYVLLYATGIAALFVLRWRDPELARPFRDWGYPFTAATVGITSLAFLVGEVVSDTRNSLLAVGLILLSWPLHQAFRRLSLRLAECIS
ncbi:APC family permease [Synechococcus sp. CBW1002]|jgi:APA family basic amino acid/polyamine antiporter|uniref:APC family permease n=1 Tax=unclassified Synechococcus TaxID=2626047 RepID=UPI0018CDC4E3|nr:MULTISPECIES: APC family permease [unclassified Synechococcus]QPN59590.1 APC family permease [Synechococcus sp. CBW1002]QPN66410.1 APC family permease [Synechococcus sp. CBW1006]